MTAEVLERLSVAAPNLASFVQAGSFVCGAKLYSLEQIAEAMEFALLRFRQRLVEGPFIATFDAASFSGTGIRMVSDKSYSLQQINEALKKS